MNLKDILKILKAEAVSNVAVAEHQLTSCHASDLISDVLTFRGPGSLLLTGLTNLQVIRTADILDFVAICLVRGKKPQPETVALAEEKEISLFVTALSMYESCGRLYAKGLPAGAKKEGNP